MNYKSNSVLIISVIINIIFIILIYSILSSEMNDNDRYIYHYITYNDIKHELKSGDLILFSNQKYTLIPRLFGHLTFSHVAIIVKRNNVLYSLEIVGNAWIYRKKKKMDGIIIIPLEERIKNYCGYIYIASLINPLTNLQINKLFNYSISNCKFLKWSDLYKFFSIFSKKSNIKMCSQFVMGILEELGITYNTQPYHFWKYHQQLIDLCDNNIYSHPIVIIPNDLIVSKLSDNKIMSIN